jgi:hypothetical protein
MPTARTLHREYFTDLDQVARGWRVVEIVHSRTGKSLLPPAFNYPDQATAERYAKAAIDQQLSPRRR